MGNIPKKQSEGAHRHDALEEAKRIMKRLTEMPHKPHEPIGSAGRAKKDKNVGKP